MAVGIIMVDYRRQKGLQSSGVANRQASRRLVSLTGFEHGNMCVGGYRNVLDGYNSGAYVTWSANSGNIR